MTRTACFDTCDCACGAIDPEFDQIAARELAAPVRLRDLSRSGIGWYASRTLGDHHLGSWPPGEGLYMLWHKDGYCPAHDLFHMRALYVGKGQFLRRLAAHWRTKPMEEEQLIYVTHLVLPNRIAKYIEQLLLDLYDFPYNKIENPGAKRLCAHLEQFEVD